MQNHFKLTFYFRTLHKLAGIHHNNNIDAAITIIIYRNASGPTEVQYLNYNYLAYPAIALYAIKVLAYSDFLVSTKRDPLVHAFTAVNRIVAAKIIPRSKLPPSP